MAVTIFLCYAHDDEDMVRRLKNHLSLLEHNGLIELRGYSNISAGSEWEQEITKHLDDAQIILLLISSSFLLLNIVIAWKYEQLSGISAGKRRLFL